MRRRVVSRKKIEICGKQAKPPGLGRGIMQKGSLAAMKNANPKASGKGRLFKILKVEEKRQALALDRELGRDGYRIGIKENSKQGWKKTRLKTKLLSQILACL